MRPFLRIDEHLTLHLARHELAEAVFRAVDENREYLRPWLPWVDDTKSVDDTKTYIRESMQHNSEGTRLTTFLLRGEEVVGSIGVVHFSKDHRKCEIGYWLSENLQGQGMMTSTCACFIDHLFRTKDLNRVEILVATNNNRSRALPPRLGFQSEGILRQALLIYQKYHDIELFSLLRSDWQSAK
ncbi:MAG: GNAT family N-acetyltransferase [Bacteroidetes bacterium]|nr:GNAT family N-acetyltransferase [Bacteroidota bacterium]